MRKLSFAILALFFVQAAQAVETWKIDGSHAAAGFTIKHLTVTNVSGNFADVSGTFQIDPTDATKTVAQATIATASVNTSNAKRDEHLKSPDFFDAKKYPTITFQSKSFAKDGDKFKVTGDLTMHGVTKEVTLASEGVTAAIKTPFGDERRGFTATGEINRKDFGLSWNKALDGGGLVLSENVKLSIDMELIKDDGKPTAQAPKATKEARSTKKKAK